MVQVMYKQFDAEMLVFVYTGMIKSSFIKKENEQGNDFIERFLPGSAAENEEQANRFRHVGDTVRLAEKFKVDKGFCITCRVFTSVVVHE